MTTKDQLALPRGLTVGTAPTRKRPHWCKWWAEIEPGKPKRPRHKFFATVAQRDRFAFGLAGDAKESGMAAFRLNPDEAREWRAFKAEIGAEVPLDAVRDCWLKYGRARAPLTVRAAVNQFIAAKTAEGLADGTVKHMGPVYDRLCAKLGAHDVTAVTREDVAAWVDGLQGAPYSIRTHQIRARTLFNWLKSSRLIPENPCDGMKPVRIVAEEVQTWAADEFGTLFEKNEGQSPELLGRLACECFAGLRHSSAAQLAPKDIDFTGRGIVLPAAKIKTRRAQYVDGLPDNIWYWLKPTDVEAWSMTPRQYLEAKSRAVTRAGLRSIHNACRHGFGTYAMAAWKDAGRVAAILCHTSQKMLWAHYKGRANEAQGSSYFLIYPTGASCPVKLPSAQTDSGMP